MKNQQARSNEDLYILLLPANRLTVRFTCLLILPLLLSGLFHAPMAFANVYSCYEPDCGENGQRVRGGALASRYLSPHSNVIFRRENGTGSELQQRYLDRTSTGTRGAFQGEALFGDLVGDWDVVTGFVTIPYSFDGITDDYLLLRGLPTERLPDSDTYQVDNWTRSAYWIDVGDGVPRVLSSQLLDPYYVPAGDDLLEQSGELNYSPLVLYKIPGEDYSQFDREAAYGIVFFITDPASGEVIDAVIDLYSENFEYEYTDYLYEGDQLMPLLITYKLDEPEFLYYAEYGEFITLSQDVEIGLANHVPGVDFVDPDLDQLEFDAATVPLVLLLEGFAESDDPEGDPVWAYSTPNPLGYSWGQSAVRIFGSRFESEDAGRAANSQRQVVRSRQ